MQSGSALPFLDLYSPWIVRNNLRRSAILGNLACNADVFILVINLGPAELGLIAAPYQNGENLIRVRLVEVQECWLPLGGYRVPRAGHVPTDRRSLANMILRFGCGELGLRTHRPNNHAG